MKLLLLFSISVAPVFAISQDGYPGKQKLYKVTVAHIRPGISSGYLAAVKDSAIWLTSNPSSIRFNAIEQADVEKLPYSNIELVSMKRKGATGRGLLFGALAGFATGALTGLIIGGDPPCNPGNVPSSPDNFFGLGTAMCEAFRFSAGDKAIVFGGMGAVGGGVIGAIIGSVARKKFIIGGRKERYKEIQLSVMNRMYHNPRPIK